MSNTILFHDAASVLTLAGSATARAGRSMSELGERRDTSVLVVDGRIAAIGDRKPLVDQAPDAVSVDCRGRTILPAWVDSHTHLIWGGDRKDELEMRLAGADYEEIFASGGGILSSVRQTRDADEDALVEQSLARVRRMQRSGTTTFEIKSGYGLDLKTELRQLRAARRLRDEYGLRVRSTCLAAHAIPEESRGDETARAEFVEHVCSVVLPAVHEAGLAEFVDVFCDRGAFTPEESRAVLAAARTLGFRFRVHANEFGHTGGARIAAEFAAASADHLLHLDAEERRLLREAGVTATLLPGTSLVLGKPFADGRALVEDGVPVAIATDCNPGSCALENLAVVLALACYGCKLSPAEAVVAATHNAAASLGVADEVGRLEVGMSADLIVLSTPDYRDLVYHGGSPLIDQVFAKGERVDT